MKVFWSRMQSDIWIARVQIEALRERTTVRHVALLIPLFVLVQIPGLLNLASRETRDMTWTRVAKPSKIFP